MTERATHTAVLEILELPDGEIVLRRAGGDEEPLARIRFSEESLGYLGGMRLAVARAMFEAGIRAAAEFAGGVAEAEEDAPREGPRLH